MAIPSILSITMVWLLGPSLLMTGLVAHHHYPEIAQVARLVHLVVAVGAEGRTSKQRSSAPAYQKMMSAASDPEHDCPPDRARHLRLRNTILSEAILSFLAHRHQPETPFLGNIIAEDALLRSSRR